MGEKSDWLDKQADSIASEIACLEDEIYDLRIKQKSLEKQAEEAELLTPKEDREWAELRAARTDHRQLALKACA